MAQPIGTNPDHLSATFRAALRWNDEDGRRQTLNLREGDTAQIGRGIENDVVLDDLGVSRHHATLAWRDGAFEIADLGSTNGTQVNGQLKSGPHRLKDGDIIRLYEVELTFLEISPETAAAAPAQPGKDQTVVVLPDSPRPRLIVSAGPDEGREITLSAGAIQIGRATAKATWDISLQDRAISRPHVQIERQEEGFLLTDLGSANGTQVNGDFIEEPVLLSDGDVIKLGETVMLFRAR